MTSKMCFRDHLADDQSLLSVFTQISPLFGATFGWKIFVKKNPFGALYGNPASMTSLQRKIPPSYAVWTAISRKEDRLAQLKSEVVKSRQSVE